jgi:hypothetical protein
MKPTIILLAVALLAGCGGEQQKEAPKPEAPPTTDTPATSPEPAQEPATPPQEPSPSPSKPASPPVSKPDIEKNATIIGEVIDLVSYATSGTLGSTPTGKEIITASAQGGNPLGLLEKGTGEVFVVTMKQANTPANAALLPFVGLQIAAKGDIYRKGGQRLLVMNTVGKTAN